MRGTYTRWTRHPAGTLHADLLGFPLAIAAEAYAYSGDWRLVLLGPDHAYGVK